MRRLIYTTKFSKDIKLLQKRGYKMQLLKSALQILQDTGVLTDKYKPHKLSGNFEGYWSAHIQSDGLIIWKHIPEANEIWLTRTGTHSDLFS